MHSARSSTQIVRLEDLEIPSLPQAVLKVIELVNDPNVSVRALAGAVKQDPGLTAMILKLANSSVFHQRARVSSLDRALILIGLNAMRSLVFGVSVVQAVDVQSKNGVHLRRFWRDSLLRACVARAIAESCDRTLTEEAYVVGLLQDIGIPPLLQVDPTYAARLAAVRGCRQSLEAEECSAGGITHSEVVQRVCDDWHFPVLLAEPLAKHHTRPASTASAEPRLTLWQIAYTVGSLPIGADDLEEIYDPNLAQFVQECFGFDRVQFEDVLQTGLEVFASLREAYADLLPKGGDATAAVSVAQQLVAAAQDTNEWLSSLRVVVVEPSRVQRNITQRMLNGMNVRSVRCVESGADALQLCTEDPPDVVTTAFHLPDMSATELEAQLRAVPSLCDLKVLLISSDNKTTATDFLDSERLSTVAKPLRPRALRRGLSSLSRDATPQVRATETAV